MESMAILSESMPFVSEITDGLNEEGRQRLEASISKMSDRTRLSVRQVLAAPGLHFNIAILNNGRGTPYTARMFTVEQEVDKELDEPEKEPGQDFKTYYDQLGAAWGQYFDTLCGSFIQEETSPEKVQLSWLRFLNFSSRFYTDRNAIGQTYHRILGYLVKLETLLMNKIREKPNSQLVPTWQKVLVEIEGEKEHFAPLVQQSDHMRGLSEKTRNGTAVA